MKEIDAILGYYQFDPDSTMVKKDENYKDETFQISKVDEKVLSPFKEEENNQENSEEENG
jgi:hypothetical protein